MQKNLPNLGRMGNNFAAKNEEIYLLCSILGYAYNHLFFGSFHIPHKFSEITVMHT